MARRGCGSKHMAHAVSHKRNTQRRIIAPTSSAQQKHRAAMLQGQGAAEQAVRFRARFQASQMLTSGHVACKGCIAPVFLANSSQSEKLSGKTRAHRRRTHQAVQQPSAPGLPPCCTTTVCGGAP